jgi:glutaconate CoA-transferase subunit B
VELGTVRDETGWELALAQDITVSQPPTSEELAILRELKARTELAHSR